MEEKKNKKIKKNFIQGGINEYDHNEGRKLYFLKILLFFIDMGGYRDIPVLTEVGKAQLEAQSATSAIAEVALRFNFLF